MLLNHRSIDGNISIRDGESGLMDSGQIALLTSTAGIFGAILGGTCGAVVSFVLTRSIPAVTVGSITVVSSPGANNPTVEVNRRVTDAITGSYVGTEKPLRNKTREREYIGYLENNRDELLDFVTEIDLVIQAADRCRNLAAIGDFDRLEELYAKQSVMTWALFESVVARNGGEFPPMAAWGETLEGDLPSNLGHAGDSDSDYMVGVRGFNLYFTWDHRAGPIRSRMRALAREIAVAFATRDEPRLVALFTWIRDNMPMVRDETQKVIDLVAAELAQYQRLSCLVVVSNVGRVPWALSADAQLVILTKGYRLEKLFKRGRDTIDDNIVVEVRLRTADQGNGQPVDEFAMVTIPTSTSATFVSMETVNNLPSHTAILQAFQGGERKARLVVHGVFPGSRGMKSVTSDAVPFRSFERQRKLPRKALR
jgi:hypothetical protein